MTEVNWAEMLETKGSFAVTKNGVFRLNIDHGLLFPKDRVLFVKIGVQDLDWRKTVISPVLGSLSGGLTGVCTSVHLPSSDGKRINSLNALSEMSANDLLRTDKDNFEVQYAEISRVEMKKSSWILDGARAGVISLDILGKKESSFDLLQGQDYGQCRSVVAAVLRDKLTDKLR